MAENASSTLPLSVQRYVTADMAEFERLLRLCEHNPACRVMTLCTTGRAARCQRVHYRDVILEFQYQLIKVPPAHGLTLSNLQVTIQGIAGSQADQMALLGTLDRLMQRGGG